MKTALPTFRITVVACFVVLISSQVSAQWATRVNLSPNAMSAALNEDMGQCLAVSGDTVHVVWSDKRTAGAAIYYCHSYDGGLTWGTGVNITDTTKYGTMPAIAASGSSVHVVWFDSAIIGRKASFYRRSLDAGNTWGPVVCLDSNTLFWPGVSANGNLVAVSLNKGVFDSTLVSMVASTDNGATWNPEVQISNRPAGTGRSEDPAIANDGHNIHLAWNDNRSGIMQIYYRHSPDYGVTWDAETMVGPNNSYSTMVCLDGAHTDVAYGNNNSGNYDVFIHQSNDTGTTWAASSLQLTSDTNPEAYPYEVRDGNNIHVVYYQVGGTTGTGPWYMFSTDGGTTWSAPLHLDNGGQPFIGYNCSTLHVIYPDSGKIYYRRNPTGNTGCITTSIGNSTSSAGAMHLKAYPNTFTKETTIEYSVPANAKTTLKIYDYLGRAVTTLADTEQLAGAVNTVTFDASALPAGIYLCRLSTGNDAQTIKLVLQK